MISAKCYSDADENRRSVIVKCPATTANMGPGYDVAGMAINIWNEVKVERADAFSVEIIGEGEGELPADKSNTIVKSLEEAYAYMGKEVPLLKYTCTNRIPFARGLGSSSNAIVCGLMAGLALENHPLSEENEELLQLATKIEGHPDNVAPTIYGGMILSYHNGTRWKATKVNVPQSLVTVAFVPDHKTSTEAARGLLKDEITKKDGVFNMARLAILVNALNNNDMDSLRDAVEDKLHQPARSALHQHLYPMIEATYAAGAHACFLSGSGPTIMALCSGKNADLTISTNAQRSEKEVAVAFLKKAEELICPGRIFISQVSPIGGTVLPEVSTINPTQNKQFDVPEKYQSLINYL